jgi:hypothetical protein
VGEERKEGWENNNMLSMISKKILIYAIGDEST